MEDKEAEGLCFQGKEVLGEMPERRIGQGKPFLAEGTSSVT